MTEEPLQLEVRPEPEPMTLQAPPPYDPHADWDKLIGAIREAAIQQHAKRTGRSPVKDPIGVGFTTEIGEDKYGNIRVPKNRGWYSTTKDKQTVPTRYALDSYGRLSLGERYRQAGRFGGPRIKPHHSKKLLAIQALAIAEFRRIFSALSAELERKAKVEGIEFKGVPTMMMGDVSREAAKNAHRLYKQNRLAERRLARLRHRASRRINFGLIPGNADRRAHAAA